MNDTCPRCRKPIKLAAVEQHPTRRDLSVQKFECANCGGVKTKILFRKQAVAAWQRKAALTENGAFRTRSLAMFA
jgi:hypothetical protein